MLPLARPFAWNTRQHVLPALELSSRNLTRYFYLDTPGDSHRQSPQARKEEIFRSLWDTFVSPLPIFSGDHRLLAFLRVTPAQSCAFPDLFSGGPVLCFLSFLEDQIMDYNPVPLSLWGVAATAAAFGGVAFLFVVIGSFQRVLPFLLARFSDLRARFGTATLVEPQSPVGTLLINGTAYATPCQAASILGISAEEAVAMASHFGEAVWSASPEPEVALRHQTLPIGRSRTKKVFVRVYSDHQQAVLVTGRERRPILGRFPLGDDGREAILRLASASS